MMKKKSKQTNHAAIKAIESNRERERETLDPSIAFHLSAVSIEERRRRSRVRTPAADFQLDGNDFFSFLFFFFFGWRFFSFRLLFLSLSFSFLFKKKNRRRGRRSSFFVVVELIFVFEKKNIPVVLFYLLLCRSDSKEIKNNQLRGERRTNSPFC